MNLFLRLKKRFPQKPYKHLYSIVFMKWGKIVLLFQAVVTLVLGIAFFAQVLTIDIAKVSELKIQVESGDLSGNTESEYIDLKQRYAAASYILLFVSLIELIIITKLLT